MLSYEAYQLAAIHDMGAPVRTYQTNKRPRIILLSWVLAITTFIFFFIAFSANHFQFSDVLGYEIVLGIMVFFALIILVPIWMTPRTTIYICSAGLITQQKNQSLAIHWQKIEWAIANEGQCTIHLFDGENIVLGKYIEKAEDLAREIELKSQLASRDEPDNIELQFERIHNNQQSRQQQKQHIISEKKALIEHETDDEAQRLQKEYQLGTIFATYHAGFKGILRNKTLSRTILRLIFPFLLVLILYKIPFFSFLPAYNFINSYDDIFTLVWTFFSTFYPLHYFARYTRLHLYQHGLIYIDIGLEGVIFEVVHWSEIEKITYHKTNPLISPPFCQLYLFNGDKIVISGYLHSQPTLKRIFEELSPIPNIK